MPFSRQVTCECVDTYIRFSFVVENKALTDIRVTDGTSNARCDEYHVWTLSDAVTAMHPDGVTGVGVTGYSIENASLDYETCMNLKEIELDSYFFVEDISIDLDRISRAVQ